MALSQAQDCMEEGATVKQRLTLCIGIALVMVILGSGWITRDAHAAPQLPATHDHTVTIMSQNMFGDAADFTPAFTATSLPALESSVGTIYQQVQASNISERAAAVADEIGEVQPALVGLQDLFQWFTGPFGSPPATTVAYDQLQSLLGALAQRGLHYAPVAISTNTNVEAPSNLGFDVRLVDHNAILARTDLPDLTLSNIQVHHFAHFLTVHTLIGTITIPEGWVSVDATIKDKTFRFLTTHLDSVSSALRVSQGNELLQGPANTSLPVVFSGDFNSDADSGDPTYLNLIAGGFVDAWVVTNPGDPGYTCCHPTISLRVDLMLVKNKVRPLDMEIVGNKPEDLTPSGLFPSDHFGVVATLRI
jgi:endonuclease/exonuclease/phosphatase family metal-dependent hydrolase